MSAVMLRLALYGLVFTVWLETSMALAQELENHVAVSIYVSACSELGVPVESFSNDVTIGGEPVKIPYYMIFMSEQTVRSMLRDGTVDLNELKDGSTIIPVKYVDGGVRAGGNELSAEGKRMVEFYCRTFM